MTSPHCRYPTVSLSHGWRASTLPRTISNFPTIVVFVLLSHGLTFPRWPIGAELSHGVSSPTDTYSPTDVLLSRNVYSPTGHSLPRVQPLPRVHRLSRGHSLPQSRPQSPPIYTSSTAVSLPWILPRRPTQNRLLDICAQVCGYTCHGREDQISPALIFDI